MKRVCVFSGSSPGADLAYRAAATDLGHRLAERFVTPQHRAMLLVSEDLGELLDGLAGWEAPAQPKWIDRAQS